MKKILMLIVTILVMVAPVLASDFAFKDVPSDHWAYDSLYQISQTGIVEGFPDGNFYGKKNITRYEFAVAVAAFYEAYLEVAQKNKIDTSSLATKSDLSDLAKKSDIPNLDNCVKTSDLNALLKLADEFKAELEALGISVNALKADVNDLKDRVAKIEAEQKRVKFSGTFTASGKYTTTKDKYLIDIDARVAKKNTKGIVFAQDFQLNIDGKVNDNIYAHMSLVAGDFLKNYYKAQPWETSANKEKITLLPYYLYTSMKFKNIGSANLGRLPFQLNKYVFKKTGGDSYSYVARMKDGNFPVDGLDYTKTFGDVDARLWLVKPQYDMYADTNLYTIDYNGIDDTMLFAYGLNTPIKLMTGAQLGFNYKKIRLEALYNYAKPFKNFKGYTKGKIDKSQIFGAKLNIPMGSFGLNGAWYRQKTNNMHYYYLMKDNDNADLWDAGITYDFRGLHLGFNYNSVGAGYAAPGGAWDGYGYLNAISNIKGWGADGNYQWGNLNIFAAYKDYKVKDSEYDRVDVAGIYNTNKLRWYKAGLGYNTGSWGTFGFRYENIDNRSYKRNYTTLDWKKNFGKVNALIGYQWVNNKDYDNKGNILYSSIGYNF